VLLRLLLLLLMLLLMLLLVLLLLLLLLLMLLVLLLRGSVAILGGALALRRVHVVSAVGHGGGVGSIVGDSRGGAYPITGEVIRRGEQVADTSNGRRSL